MVDLTRDRLVGLREYSESLPLRRHYTVGFTPQGYHRLADRSPSDVRIFKVPRDKLPPTTGVSKGFDEGEYLVRGDVPISGAEVQGGPRGPYTYELPFEDVPSFSPLLKALTAERVVNKGLNQFPSGGYYEDPIY